MFHIVWYSPLTSEITIGVVGCNRVWWDVNVKVDVKVLPFKRGLISTVGRGDRVESDYTCNKNTVFRIVSD